MADEITLDAPETRLERFLAAAAGVEGITLDEPETRIEKYLYKIAQCSGGVPPVEDADKGKYLHANESTGDLEWASGGGSSGGVLVVTDTDGTLDKTWEEINAAVKGGLVYVGVQYGDEVVNQGIIYSTEITRNRQGEVIGYSVSALYRSSATPSFCDWTTETADGYPVLES